MGFRLQKRIKLLPGVSVNLSKSGISTSLGPKGAKVTLGHGKQRTTVGIPGTGISHTSYKTTGGTSWGVVIGVIGAVIVGLVLVTRMLYK